MGRYMGPRKDYLIRIPQTVDLRSLATEAGYSTVSRYAADVFCDISGQPEKKVGPDQSKEGDTGGQLRLPA